MAINHNRPRPHLSKWMRTLADEGAWGEDYGKGKAESEMEEVKVRQCFDTRFARIVVTTCRDGADIEIRARNDYVNEQVEYDAGVAVVHVRKDTAPRIGERVMCGGTLVKVCDRRPTSRGWQVLDEDTRVWHYVEKGR